ncbi:MAG: hypothetical protein GW928_00420 [Rhodoferax sp.]|uniref:Uncharacterized protein n=1 Tax=Candidatus Magasanikbacteria bacterium CG_4_9_14_0_2_um_filter_42_11 TaxID=1974643 RepID=A0A2M8F8K0_9BACT|nr:hypothetical protein [Rhodoferax sp.]PIR75093.1 MAG: hypothetical protein COU34_04635 [Candidatus Magasanikbacteria bacterium CG10_big_fil_rev_8_21_14_0_10_43_9]PIY92961.1 MAG: hypothetical protein COY70_00560 [Candidatus Magasanikbacteria bacterium CG_4_10_14_0_8_um_filter_42_12]PJC52047.1 MAG: hypothetical protein CO030_04970 [Candidatus Magasanikbacteria bacterium CG_4_9_14_0_2_um_filter_42_11]
MKKQQKHYTTEEAKEVASTIGINWDTVKFDLEQFTNGMNVEAEHGKNDPETNVTNDDPIITGKIAWAHLKEFADYYIRLEKMEKEAEAEME